MSFFKKILGGIFGAGGGGAAKEYEKQEEERRANIEAAQKMLESIFNSPQRQQEIQQYIDAQRGLLQSDLNRTKDEQDRQLKFALARGGLAGGSVDIDKNQNLAEMYVRGLIEAERKAQGAGATLQADDQAAKHSLFAQVASGLDATTASQNAAQALRTNVALARTDANVGAFDTLFGNLSGWYENTRQAAGERKAQKYDFGTLFAPLPATYGNVAGATPYNPGQNQQSPYGVQWS